MAKNKRIRLPRGKFGVIYADPPWAFKTYSNKRTTPHRCVKDHYDVMESGDLDKIPVWNIAAKDCALFMWVVDIHVADALKLAKAWGFEFKTIAFVWAKLKKNPEDISENAFGMGMGYWTRKQCEICLLFTKGRPKVLDHGVRQIIVESRREHSRKPDCVPGRIERLVGGPYVELFGRRKRKGWTVWGNQTDKFK